MQFISTNIPEIIIIKPKVFGDLRGYFLESYRRDLFCKHIGSVDFLQDNESKSSYGVLRGLHYQLPPFAQSKLVRVITGKVLDVAVDIRRYSPYFGQHVATILSEDEKEQLFIPKGFAHGFVVLSESAIFAYKVDAPYAPDHEHGLRFDDPELKISWSLPFDKIQISEKDRQNSLLNQAKLFEHLI